MCDPDPTFLIWSFEATTRITYTGFLPSNDQHNRVISGLVIELNVNTTIEGMHRLRVAGRDRMSPFDSKVILTRFAHNTSEALNPRSSNIYKTGNLLRKERMFNL